MIKKIISIIVLIAICTSTISFASAQDKLSVKHSVIKLQEEFCDININIPYFEGFSGADDINRNIRNMVADSIGQVRRAGLDLKQYNEELIKKGEKPYVNKTSLDITYDYIKSGDILSLQLNTYMYLGGAHPTNWINSFTVNTKTGEIYSLKNLFKENVDYVTLLTNEIIAAINKSPDFYFEDYAKTIKDKNGDFNFYFDGDKLVIYFGLYEIAPYAAGIRRFVFDANDLKGKLKDEVYNSVKNAKPLGSIRLNGSDMESNKTANLTNEGVMVPLRVIAEALGYKVDWNAKDGAIIAGGFIKDKVNSYWTTGKEPVSLVAPYVSQGVTYVPIQYFRDVLGENVYFDNMNFTYVSDSGKKNLSENVIKIFSKTGYEDNYNNLIVQYIDQRSEEDCVKMYAEAVKFRNGAVQYALLTDELRKEKYEYFNELNFVTGVSSPWVDSYDIKKLDDSKYQINFHMKTSAPAPVPDEITTITLTKVGEICRISSIETVNQ